MELPLGMYPFSFEYLEQLHPTDRKQYLDKLEALWLQYISNHHEKQPKPNETNESWRQRLHLEFLHQIIGFYNTRFYAPSLPDTQLLP